MATGNSCRNFGSFMSSPQTCILKWKMSHIHSKLVKAIREELQWPEDDPNRPKSKTFLPSRPELSLLTLLPIGHTSIPAPEPDQDDENVLQQPFFASMTRCVKINQSLSTFVTLALPNYLFHAPNWAIRAGRTALMPFFKSRPSPHNVTSTQIFMNKIIAKNNSLLCLLSAFGNCISTLYHQVWIWARSWRRHVLIINQEGK